MHESIAVSEAKRLEIPVVSIVDTNTDPDTVDYPIPANDDSIRAIKLIVGEISRSICDSRSIAYPTGPTPESGSSEDVESEITEDEIATENSVSKDESAKDEEGDIKA